MKLSTLFLYGPSCSGKTTIGGMLAKSLDLPFFDLDFEIEKHCGRNIPEIFASDGEPAFREMERTVLRQLLAEHKGVVALGGGSLLDTNSYALVESFGPILALHAPLEELLVRLKTDKIQRPLLIGDTRTRLSELLDRRRLHYGSFPNQLNTGGLTPTEATRAAQLRLGMFYVRAGESMSSSGKSSYDVRIYPGGLDSVGELMRFRGLKGPVAIISDETVGRMYARRVQRSLEKAGFYSHLIFVPAGEEHKNTRTVSFVWDQLMAARLERSSTVVALGGGMVMDLAGFAAATYLRGIRWVALPTSLLAMVDASLGGKTGVDLPEGKNLVGAFHPPSLVLADPNTLASLPPSEIRNGLGEVVKHGVIGDPALFELCAGLEGQVDFQQKTSELTEIIRRAMALKIQVIEADPYEHGQRAILNLGHTIGHAVELASNYQIRHGEAVGIGMVTEARLAEQVGLAEAGLAQDIAGVLLSLGLPTEIPPGLDHSAILRAMEQDKKRVDGKIHFTLPHRIGKVSYGIELEPDLLERGIQPVSVPAAVLPAFSEKAPIQEFH